MGFCSYTTVRIMPTDAVNNPAIFISQPPSHSLFSKAEYNSQFHLSNTSGPTVSLKCRLGSYWQYNSRTILSANFWSRRLRPPPLSSAVGLGGASIISLRLVHSRHCHVSLSLPTRCHAH